MRRHKGNGYIIKSIVRTTIIVLVFFAMFRPDCFAFGPTQYEDDHLYYIQNVRSGKYLTMNGNNIEQSELSHMQNQRFFIRYATTISGVDYYSITPDADNSKRIEVVNASDSNGANIGVFMQNPYYPTAQEFRFFYNDGYAYQIMPALSSTRVFDVANASYLDGANIGLYTKRSINDTYVGAQLFKLYTVEKSLYTYNCIDNSKHLTYKTQNIYKSYVEGARDIWNSYKSGVIRSYIPIIRPHSVSIEGSSSLPASALAITDYNANKILISNQWTSLNDNQKQCLLLHEFGHALGIGHIDSENDFMYYANNGVTILSDSDKSSYSSAYLNY